MIEAYRTDNTDYTKNGDMPLLPINAKVNVELNGTWALELEHPIDDEGRWKYLKEEAVVKCPSFNGDQLFRIKSIEKNDDSVLVKAYPIFFDSKNDCFLTDIRPTGKNGQDALNIMLAPNKKYSAQSDIAKSTTAYYEYMNLMEAINGDNANSFLNRWGGEILYDNFKIIVNERIGGDYGVELRYGKNIPANGITETVDMSEVVTRIYPKSYNGYKLSGNGYVDSPILSNYPTVKAATMKFDNIKMREDAQEDDEEKGVVICDTKAELDKALTEACKKQFEAGLDKPKVTIEADMVLLQNTDQYKDYEILETVSLGDTIHCLHNKLGIETDARVIELEYDCLTERVVSVVLGDFKQNYLDKVAGSVDKIESVITPDGGLMADKVEGFLNAIKTQIRYQKSVAKKQDIRAILFEDLDPESPLYGALCLGTLGLQISKRRTADGRDWDWTTAFDANGGYADTLVSGRLSDKTGTNFWNLDTGDFQMSSKAFTVDGQTIGQIAQGAEQNAINAANQALSDYANTVTKDIENLQSQVDGQVEDYYYDYEPSMQNIPASKWTTTEERKKHIGDRFFWKTKGYAYRFMENNGVWGWTLLQDTDITKAMQTAQNAKDTADGKRRTFITQPVPPYDIGDMWTNGEDILTCSVSRASGASYVSTDWEKLNKYTDDTIANQALEEVQKSLNLTMIFDRSYQEVPVKEDGGISKQFPNVEVKVSVYQGHDNITDSCSFVVSNLSGIKGTFNNTNHAFVVSEMSAKTGRVEITAVYMNKINISGRFDIKAVRYSDYGIENRMYFISIDYPVVKRKEDGTVFCTKENSTSEFGIMNCNIMSYKPDNKKDTYFKSGKVIISATKDGKNYEVIKEEENVSGTQINVKTESLVKQAQKIKVEALLKDRAGEYRLVAVRYLDVLNVIESREITHEQVFNLLTQNGAIKGIYKIGNQLYISFTYARGGILSLGGANNGNGILEILDSAGKQIGKIDRDGINASGELELYKIILGWALKTVIGETVTWYYGRDIQRGGLEISATYSQETGKIIISPAPYKNTSSYTDRATNLISSDRNLIIEAKKGESNDWSALSFGKTGDASGGVSISVGMNNVSYETFGCSIASDSTYSSRIASSKGVMELDRYGIRMNGGVTTDSLSVTGTKSRKAKTINYNNRLLYSYEMPCPMFGDIGEAETDKSGVCYIYLDDIFTETINTGIEYQVFLQKEGQGDLWVDSKEHAYFVIKGTPGLKFSWEIKAKQRDYEYERLEDTELAENDINIIDYEEQGQKLFEEYLLEKETAYEESN